MLPWSVLAPRAEGSLQESVLTRQNFIRAPSKQIRVFVPGIFLSKRYLHPEPSLGAFLNTKIKVRLVPGGRRCHLVFTSRLKAWHLEADRPGFQLQLLLYLAVRLWRSHLTSLSLSSHYIKYLPGRVDSICAEVLMCAQYLVYSRSLINGRAMAVMSGCNYHPPP